MMFKARLSRAFCGAVTGKSRLEEGPGEVERRCPSPLPSRFQARKPARSLGHFSGRGSGTTADPEPISRRAPRADRACARTRREK